MTKDYPWGKGTPTWTRDATADDSDKSFTVPAGKVWDLVAIESTLVATATVGNRQLQFIITNGVATVYTGTRAPNITASQAGVALWDFSNGDGYSAAQVRVRLDTLAGPNVYVTCPEAKTILPAGYVIRVYDAAAVDAAADDLTVVLHYVEYDA